MRPNCSLKAELLLIGEIYQQPGCRLSLADGGNAQVSACAAVPGEDIAEQTFLGLSLEDE